MIRNGDVELRAREEEIRFLKMEVTVCVLNCSFYATAQLICFLYAETV